MGAVTSLMSAAESERQAGGPPKILLVDDEPKNLIAFQAILEGDDRELVCVGSGDEALRQLLRHDFALIVLDVHMPGMDGFETAELIRARERSREIPILFITAAVRGEFAISRGYALGAVDYLLRPIEADVLRFKVNVFVDLYRKTDEVRRQANELAESRALLSSVLQGATAHAIAALDPQGRLQMWNDGAHEMYGRPASSVLDRPVSMLFPGRGAGGTVQSLLNRVDRLGYVEEECEQQRTDGSTFYACIHLSQRKDSAGKPAGYVFIAEDVSDARNAEQQRVELVELRQANAIKDEFLGLISHELRTPLTTILGNAQSLAKRHAHLPADVVEESLEDVVHNARRLQTMVESMLLLSHLETGQPLELEPLLLQRLLAEVADEFRSFSPLAVVEAEVPNDLPPVIAHPAYVSQIVMNLLSNALKYSPLGSPVTVSATVVDDRVTVSVLDRGSGITEEEARVVFEPFKRLTRTQFQAAGAGLGLAVCSRLVAVLDGTIGAHPRKGGGSDFFFTLPALVEPDEA
jgi:PAS domain S-box-containing protein